MVVMRSKEALVIGTLALGAVALGAAGCGEEPVPTVVTYSQHIKPLVEAHCIRCHGAGGMFNADPYAVPVNNSQGPTNGDFTTLNDVGTAPNVVYGLLHYTGAGAILMKAYLLEMPPAPAPPLTDRENQMMLNWIANPQL
jgi:hypothetical protein